MMKRGILIIILIAFFFFVLKFFFFKTTSISTSPYYAVFLANGQVYFGHMSKLDATTMQLIDVYYLQINTNLSSEALQSKKNKTDFHLTLIKLGQEIHGPTDQMFINRQQILFWEKLRNDGEVIQAIKRHL